MRKSLIFAVTLVFSAAMFFNSAYWVFAEDELTSEEVTAEIVYLKGDVKVQRKGEDSWIAAEEGMLLDNGDKIKTSADSEAEISLDYTSKNVIKLESNTEITLEDLDDKKVYLPLGNVLSILEELPAESSFEIRTPTAVAGVYGSGMSVETDGKNTYVYCFEDEAYVYGINKDGTLTERSLIKEGYTCGIRRFRRPGKRIAIAAYRKKRWQQFRRDIRRRPRLRRTRRRRRRARRRIRRRLR